MPHHDAARPEVVELSPVYYTLKFARRPEELAPTDVSLPWIGHYAESRLAGVVNRLQEQTLRRRCHLNINVRKLISDVADAREGRARIHHPSTRLGGPV